MDIGEKRDWCLLVVNFLLREGDPFRGQLIEVIDGCVERGDKRGLSMVKGDLGQWARGYPAERVNELNSILVRRLGVGIGSVENRINRILKRGEIRTRKDYEIVEERLDQISQMEVAQRSKYHEESEKLNQYLIRFEEKTSSEGRDI